MLIILTPLFSLNNTDVCWHEHESHFSKHPVLFQPDQPGSQLMTCYWGQLQLVAPVIVWHYSACWSLEAGGLNTNWQRDYSYSTLLLAFILNVQVSVSMHSSCFYSSTLPPLCDAYTEEICSNCFSYNPFRGDILNLWFPLHFLEVIDILSNMKKDEIWGEQTAASIAEIV